MLLLPLIYCKSNEVCLVINKEKIWGSEDVWPLIGCRQIETEEAMGAPVGRGKVDSMSLSGCAWVERISLQCLPHRNIYSTARHSEKKSLLWLLWLVTVWAFYVYFKFSCFLVIFCVCVCVWSDNLKTIVTPAAAALADNRGFILLVLSCLLCPRFMNLVLNVRCRCKNKICWWVFPDSHQVTLVTQSTPTLI